METCEHFHSTSSYDHNRCDSKSRSQTPESQISPNTSNIAYNDFNSLFVDPASNYMRQIPPQMITNYPSPAVFNLKHYDEYSGTYQDIKVALDLFFIIYIVLLLLF